MSEAGEENIIVVVRIRPIQQLEINKGEKPCVDSSANGKEVQIRTSPLDAHVYRCNACFPSNTTQSAFFERCGVKNLLDSALQGYRACAFAFGQVTICYYHLKPRNLLLITSFFVNFVGSK
jgi:Kinesin motor domain